MKKLLQDINWLEPEPNTEKMPRIFVDDFLNLLDSSPERLIAVDIRNNIQWVFYSQNEN